MRLLFETPEDGMSKIPQDLQAKMQQHDIVVGDVVIDAHIRGRTKESLRSFVTDLKSNNYLGYKVSKTKDQECKKTVASSVCPQGTIFNPRTQRCIKADGKVARKLGLFIPPPKPVKAPKVPKASKVPAPKANAVKPVKAKAAKVAKTSKETKNPEAVTCPSSKLKGKQFVFSGFKDDLIIEQVKACGGDVTPKLTEATNYLVIYNDEAKVGKKYHEALSRGIKVLSFYQLVKQGQLKTNTVLVPFKN